MTLLKKIFSSLTVILMLLVIIGFFLPSSYKVERSTTIKAPVPVIFGNVNDLKKSEKWSPWKAADATMKISYGKMTVGKGATSSWTSEQSGSGSMTIIESIENKLIKTNLIFNGWSTAKGYWTFSQQKGFVKVTQGLEGDAGYNLIARYVNLFMDSMVGPDFEDGLRRLKKIAEGE